MNGLCTYFLPLNDVNDCACFKEHNISIILFVENLIEQN